MTVRLPARFLVQIALVCCLLPFSGDVCALNTNVPAPRPLTVEDTQADTPGARIPPPGVTIVEVRGAQGTAGIYWLVPPAAPLFTGVALAGPADFRLLESSGAELRVLASYDQTRVYYLIEGTPSAGEETLSQVGDVLWRTGGEYLLSTEAGLETWLPDAALRVVPLFPTALLPGPVAQETGRVQPESAPASGLPPEKFWIERMVGSVSQADLLRHISSLSGAIPVDLSTGRHTIGSRYVHHPDCLRAAEYLYAQFDSMGIDVQYDSFLGNYARCVEFVGPSGYIVGDRGTIFHTTDRGVTWERQVSGVTRSLLRCSFVSADTGWVVGTLGTVLRTIDGGSTWTNCGPGSLAHFYGVKFVSALTGWVCGAGGAIYRTDDGGQSWMRQPVELPDDALYDVEFIDSANGWVVGYGGALLRTKDGGRTWECRHSSGYESLYDACFADSLRGWAVGWGGIILRTSDGGHSWARQNSGVTNTLTGVCFADSLNGWAVGWGALVLATGDGGAHWSTRPSGVVTDLYSVCFTDAQSGWVVGMEHLIGSSDGGVCWRSFNDRLPGIWTNVVATLEGTKNPSETYVLCGHYDSISRTPMVSAPGADDNASGTSLLLEAARVLKDYGFESTVKFICLSAEEMIYWSGSRHYAAAARLRGDDIRGTLNFDMVAYGTRAVYLIGNKASSGLLDRCVAARDSFVQVIPVTRVVDDTWRMSDHVSFWDKGYPAICGIEVDNETNPYWHTTGDVVGRLNMTLATDITKLAVASVALMARLSAPPKVVAVVDADPDVLNLTSRGQYVTCYVELPLEHPVSAVDVPSVLLNYAVRAEPEPSAVGDHDADGIPDLMLKFDRSRVQEILSAGDNVEVSLVGEVGKSVFFGSDTIEVIGERDRYVSSEQNGEELLAATDAANGDVTVESAGAAGPAGSAGLTVPAYRLLQNYPQPFNPATTIQYELPDASHVCIRVFDVTGKALRTLVDGQVPAGVHAVVWHGEDDAGRPLASGVYVCTMTAGAHVSARKMVLTR